MTEIEKRTPSTGEYDEQRGGKRLPLLLLLILLLLLTSSLVGYILGKKADSLPGGQLIDTILLTPETENEKSVVLHLTGRVLYTDGTPAAGRTLELHSEPMRTVTDSAGAFLFDHVPLGEHNLAVLDSSGRKEAERSVVLDRKQMSEGISIDMNDEGIYVVELAMDVRMLEIYIELDAENYSINQEYLTYETTDGTVVTPAGKASIQNGPVVTPAGNVCLPDGTIVLSGKMDDDPTAVILPDDTVIYPEEPLNAGAIEILPDGTVNLPNGTVIEPDGDIRTPDGAVNQPGTGGLLVTEDEVIPIGSLGENPSSGDAARDASGAGNESAPAPEPVIGNVGGETLDRGTETAGRETSEDTRDGISGESGASGGPGGGNGQGSGGSHSGGSNSGGHGGGSGTTSPGSTEESTTESTEDSTQDSTEESSGGSSEESTEDPDKGVLDVLGQKENTSDYISWTQISTIDLFYNRDNGTEPIAPGSRGYYQFRLKNTRKEALSIRLTMAEKDVHLPLSFTLTPKSRTAGWRRETAVQGTLKGKNARMVLSTEIGAGEEKDYRLDWEWPAEGNDTEDTQAGKAGKSYTLTLTIQAEGTGE